MSVISAPVSSVYQSMTYDEVRVSPFKGFAPTYVDYIPESSLGAARLPRYRIVSRMQMYGEGQPGKRKYEMNRGSPVITAKRLFRQALRSCYYACFVALLDKKDTKNFHSGHHPQYIVNQLQAEPVLSNRLNRQKYVQNWGSSI